MAELAISAVALALAIFDRVKELFPVRSNDGSANLPDTVYEAKAWLTKMQASLSELEDRIDGGSNRLQQYVNHVENTAYDIEDALSECLLHISNESESSQKIHAIFPFLPGNEVKKARRKLSSKMIHIMKSKECYNELENHLPQSSSSTRKEAWPDQVLAEGDEIVGFETRDKELVTQLMGTDKSRLTILIAGPGGSGKSTVVKNIYRSNRIRGHDGFGSCHAWVHVPNKELEKLLQEILEQFEVQRQEGKNKNAKTVRDEENVTEQKLKLLLQKKKFLVVLDNVWSNDHLDFIVKCLPNGLPGSKIIITTRRSDVTSLPPHYIHDLSSGLSSEKAKDLFCKKAFPNSPGNWPPIVEVWAQRILNMCEGMPLAISAIGTFLAQKPHIPVEWKTVHDNLGSQICKDSSVLSVISRNLQPSYRDLPSNLKSCFLYFSMFPQDYSISRERLIRLWVAEGFVMSEGGQPEKEAADLLEELVKRNLVVASAREVDGRRVRKCRVLHLVREINILRRKSFLTVLEQNYNPSADRIRRLSINDGPIKSIKGMTAHIRTLLVFGLASSHSEVEIILKNSKFLRVLDLQGVALEEFPDHVVGLTLLKYLSLKKTQIKTVPKSIKKLVDLETLDLRHTSVSCLPNEICKLEKLRHLLVFCNDVGSSGGVDLSAGNLGALSSIQKLSFIKVESDRRILIALSELTGLRKLGLTDLKKEDGEELCGTIQKMQNLSTLDVSSTSEDEYLDLDHMSNPPLYLQHLYLEGRLEMVPKWIPELTSLTKIGLTWSKLNADQADPLEAIQALPNLMELDLVNYYTGNELIFKAHTFLKLMKLTINHFEQLTLMDVKDGAMPLLKNLTMWRCQNLKSLPAGIGGLILLKEFHLYDMADEFIAKLQKDSEDRQVVQHIGVIQYYDGNNQSLIRDLSPSQWH